MSNSISGNSGLANCLVVLSGAANATTTADGSGNFSFTGLSAGTYAVLCQQSGYSFSPWTSTQVVSGSNITGVNFTASAQAIATPIWNKQGVVISNTTTTSTFGVSEVTVIQEGNAQILSGTVFKMWFTGKQQSGGHNCINYAESTDGINWTQYSSNPVISNAHAGHVFKNGSTYYGYYVSGDEGVNITSINQYTSSDGIHWTLANSGVLTTGSAGAWDSRNVYNMQVVQISGGTWYAVYSAGTGASANSLNGLGLATSPDGVTWTKYAGNPVLYNFTDPSFLNVNGTWYAWGDITLYNQGGSDPYIFPTIFYRTSSTDLMHWTTPVPSLANTLPFEGSGGNFQLDSPWLLQVGSQTYMWYDATASGAAAGTGFQIALAVANYSPASLVSFAAEENKVTLTQVQNTLVVSSAGASSVSATFASHPSAGNLLVCLCYQTVPGGAGGTPTMAIADTPNGGSSNTWTPVLVSVHALGLGNGGWVQGWACINKATGANTVTVTPSITASRFTSIAIFEVSGVSNGSFAIDQSGTATIATIDVIPEVDLTTTQAVEALFAITECGGTLSTPPTINGPYTLGTQSGGSENVWSAYALQTIKGTYKYLGSYSGGSTANNGSFAFSISLPQPASSYSSFLQNFRGFVNKRGQASLVRH